MLGKDRSVAALEDNIATVSPPDSALDEKSAHSSDLDDNYAIYKQNAEQDIDAGEEKRVLRKIDRRLLPILIVRLASNVRVDANRLIR